MIGWGVSGNARHASIFEVLFKAFGPLRPPSRPAPATPATTQATPAPCHTGPLPYRHLTRLLSEYFRARVSECDQYLKDCIVTESMI